MTSSINCRRLPTYFRQNCPKLRFTEEYEWKMTKPKTEAGDMLTGLRDVKMFLWLSIRNSAASTDYLVTISALGATNILCGGRASIIWYIQALLIIQHLHRLKHLTNYNYNGWRSLNTTDILQTDHASAAVASHRIQKQSRSDTCIWKCRYAHRQFYRNLHTVLECWDGSNQ